MNRFTYLVIVTFALAGASSVALENKYADYQQTEELGTIFKKHTQRHKARLLAGAPTVEQTAAIHNLEKQLAHLKYTVKEAQQTVQDSATHHAINAELHKIQQSVHTIERIIRQAR